MHAWYGMGGYGALGYGFPWVGLGLWALLLAGLAFFGIAVVKALRARNPSHEGALDILVERFAKGEITKEQFLEMRDAIEKKK